ncbi:MAG: cupin domain-containing protein [Actinobacteria bacterium]|nr:cupin domain-containing protein [Actinomycetota bacterium]
MSALDRLAVDPARFISEIYGTRPEVTAAAQDYSWLASLDAFDHLITDTVLPAAAFRLVRDGSPIPVKGYTKTFGNRDDTIRVADPALVFDWFSQGATIILESLHAFSPALRDFCRELERELRRGTQVNAYITPPGARGFSAHVDSHDVFVVQVYGAKHWFVHDRSDPDAIGDPLIDRDLEVGDCLYIPQGFPHWASTGAAASAHLTIGILPTTVAQIKRELMSLVDLDEDAMNIHADPSKVASDVLLQTQARLESIDDELSRRLTRLFFASRHHSLRGQLMRSLDAEKVSDSDKVVARIEWTRFDRDDGILVLLPDRELRFSARLAPALDVILREGPFKVSELAPHLDEDERRAVVARLIREGLLELR